ncbi:MAG: PaaI family thioesterase [Acidimicrobiales bacterium]
MSDNGGTTTSAADSSGRPEPAPTVEEQDRGWEEVSPEHVELAAQIRRLGHAVLSRELDKTQVAEMTDQLGALSDALELRPHISKAENLFRRNRIAAFVETGRWPEPPPNGSSIEFDPASIVGGQLNPFGMETRYYRQDNEAVGLANLGPCFEGPPERVHGGVICAIFDEVMGSVFRATGTPSAFTGELTVRFEGPAPLNTELEFRARRVDSQGRRQLLEGEARSPQGQFASARATFIEMKPEHFPTPDD